MTFHARGAIVPRLIALTALLGLVWVTLWLSRPAPPVPESVLVPVEIRVDGERMFADLAWLAAPGREGRMAGSPGGIAAREWIVERFTEVGLIPAAPDGWLHHFSFETRSGQVIEDAANIMGVLPGMDPRLGVIAITAHYDHLGVTEEGIFHGADDNASGVAAIIELARWFAVEHPRHTLMFIAFDAEEHGKVGAYRMFEDGLHTLERWRPVFNVNLDMVSRDVRGTLYAVGTTHQPWLHTLLDRLDDVALVEIGRDPAKDAEWTSASDHAAFHDQGIPFIYFGVDDHPDYHRPTDTADRVDRGFFTCAVETILHLLLILDETGIP